MRPVRVWGDEGWMGGCPPSGKRRVPLCHEWGGGRSSAGAARAHVGGAAAGELEQCAGRHAEHEVTARKGWTLSTVALG